ncbi:APC family permease [Nocardia sp. CWNU-33]|uniref:APC family permease n=1 Tax=Nocardia sp. CWNU-33 TaxID=3392117 RepID=UPI00398E82AB
MAGDTAVPPPVASGPIVAASAEPFVDKGLAAGKVGTLAGAVLGISCVAPGYTLTASIGLIVAAVGLKMPAILIAGFIPMFLTAYAYRELNSRVPDCGASFTWSAKAFGPYTGWMCGWGMVMASVIVLSNLASIAVEFCYLFLARIFSDPGIADLAGNKGINIATTLLFLAVATFIASRGITTSQHVQYVLVGFQMIVLLAFAVVALVHVGRGAAPGSLGFSFDWFNPFTGITLSAFAVGLTGSIFAFWGWDTCLTLGEESKDPTKVPGRAGLLCVLSILLTYLLVAVAVMMYAGVGASGLGLGNEENAGNVFGALADPVLGGWAGPLLMLAVLASSAASLQTTFLPAARTMLAMGAYGAFPNKFAEVSPRFLVPSFSTIVAGVVTGVFYTVVTLLSEHTLLDTVAALGIMICWYYGITAFACVWYFRGELFSSVRNAVFKLLFPLLGGLMLATVFVISVRESMNPDNGSGASVGGVGLVFFMGFGMLCLGAVLMSVMRWRNPEFFRDNTLTRQTPVISDDAVVIRVDKR